MSKVVLHIGTHKTATTTIQNTFWSNSDLLRGHGIIYPRLSTRPNVTGHHGLVCDWAQLPEVYRLPQGSRDDLKKLSDQYSDGDNLVFLSSEEFSRGNPGRTTDFVELRELLSGFDEIQVVCTLRTQWQFLQSVYLEMSKYHNPRRPPSLVKPVISTGMFEGLYVDYNLLLDRLLTAFSLNEIRFFDFSTIRRTEGGVIGHFLNFLDSNLTVADLEPINEGASNASPMPMASWCANILSEPHVAPEWLVKKIERAIYDEYGEDVSSCLFTREEFLQLKTHFEARNAELSARCDESRPDFRISEARSEGLTLFRNQTSATLWMRTARGLLRDRL